MRPKIIFLGTPDFAVATLRALVENRLLVVAVVTAPDKPAGRGLKLTESAVKQYALLKNIPVLQPLKLKDPEFLAQLKSFQADLQVVVAFRMLPEVVWAMPPMGTINLHGSLLPQYRGAAPINRVIMNGERKTGVTTFKLKQEIDTGNILLMEEIAIGSNETAGELHDRMKEKGAALVVKTIQGLTDGSLQEKPQNISGLGELKTAPKLYTADGEIHWTESILKIHNQIRGLSPFPGAFTFLKEKNLKILVPGLRNPKNICCPVSWKRMENNGSGFPLLMVIFMQRKCNGKERKDWWLLIFYGDTGLKLKAQN